MDEEELKSKEARWRESHERLVAASEVTGMLKERIRVAEFIQNYVKAGWLDRDTYKMIMEDLLEGEGSE